MQYTSIALSLLAASGVYAAPSYPYANTTTSSWMGSSNTTAAATNGTGSTSGSGSGSGIHVTLSNIQAEIGVQLTFKEGVRDIQRSPLQGPFQTFELSVGPEVLDQDLRCQALDLDGHPLVAIRGDNIDTTFSDAGNGEWTFAEVSEVSAVICDPAFVAMPDPDLLETRSESLD
ncbi:hypothetical protein PV10_07510 [Exophiala mesophila]|uniref:Uncharacterized protein n=1 Tax=Exophiala mesophila TaxID=212818 RepID=A0A0D1Z835_EXOME|nr:uncharacterized protein PV10_07510 [Exophiala mesophila]KIV90179.1 hypothetical protein PV10_07510 [Exophiala mesophila]